MNERIIDIIKRACALDEQIDENSELRSLSLDSLSFITAIVELETELDISFEPEELNIAAWQTVGDFIHAAEEKINA